MMWVCVVARPDGGVSVIVPSLSTKPDDVTGEAWCRTRCRATQRADPALVDAPAVMVPRDAVPATRRWRTAWTLSGGALVVDMPRAREQRRAEIRRERDRRLVASDGPFLRELDRAGGPRPAWTTYRQALRDLPATLDLDAIQDPEALAAFEPAWPPLPEAG